MTETDRTNLRKTCKVSASIYFITLPRLYFLAKKKKKRIEELKLIPSVYKSKITIKKLTTG